jgi:hypothetical protein
LLVARPGRSNNGTSVLSLGVAVSIRPRPRSAWGVTSEKTNGTMASVMMMYGAHQVQVFNAALPDVYFRISRNISARFARHGRGRCACTGRNAWQDKRSISSGLARAS